MECLSCGARSDVILVCSACKSAQYCSRECQALHWRAPNGHKRACAPRTTVLLSNSGPREELLQPAQAAELPTEDSPPRRSAPLPREIISSSNYRDLYSVGVSPEQLRFIDPPAEFMLEVAYGPTKIIPFLLYDEQRLPIGFAAIRPPDAAHPNDVALRRFMINTELQNRGYGKRHLQGLIDYIRATYIDAKRVVLSVHIDALAAQSLYRAVGFVPVTGEASGDHYEYTLTLRP